MSVIDGLGWIATSVIVASYFCRTLERLRAVQMAAAVVWTIYGISIGAPPVIAANVLVLAAAAWTLYRDSISGSAAAAARMPDRSGMSGPSSFSKTR